jgi:hypothetical protein
MAWYRNNDTGVVFDLPDSIVALVLADRHAQYNMTPCDPPNALQAQQEGPGGAEVPNPSRVSDTGNTAPLEGSEEDGEDEEDEPSAETVEPSPSRRRKRG